MVALKQWGQYSRSTERMVLEHGRLGRPERFFAGFAQVAFPEEMQLAQNLQKRGSRGSASACTGLLLPWRRMPCGPLRDECLGCRLIRRAVPGREVAPGDGLRGTPLITSRVQRVSHHDCHKWRAGCFHRRQSSHQRHLLQLGSLPAHPGGRPDRISSRPL